MCEKRGHLVVCGMPQVRRLKQLRERRIEPADESFEQSETGILHWKSTAVGHGHNRARENTGVGPPAHDDFSAERVCGHRECLVSFAAAKHDRLEKGGQIRIDARDEHAQF